MLVYYNTSCFSYCWKVVNSGVFDLPYTNTYTHVCKKCNDQIDLLKEMQRVTETNYESSNIVTIHLSIRPRIQTV